jgi:hypothetical protein
VEGHLPFQKQDGPLFPRFPERGGVGVAIHMSSLVQVGAITVRVDKDSPLLFGVKGGEIWDQSSVEGYCSNVVFF